MSGLPQGFQLFVLSRQVGAEVWHRLSPEPQPSDSPAGLGSHRWERTQDLCQLMAAHASLADVEMGSWSCVPLQMCQLQAQ